MSDGPIFVDRTQDVQPPTLDTPEGWDFWVQDFQNAKHAVKILRNLIECGQSGQTFEFTEVEGLPPLGPGLDRYTYARGLVTVLGQTISILMYMGISPAELAATAQQLIDVSLREFKEHLDDDPVARGIRGKSKGEA
jgi:hypothetical protein